ncbi:hypothetical protein BKH40_04130 [Helicobacter sp. 11S02629-2]|nr:hypothetical protein BKH40_04130 [Helicobacter sp. 11S02629-2]
MVAKSISIYISFLSLKTHIKKRYKWIFIAFVNVLAKLLTLGISIATNTSDSFFNLIYFYFKATLVSFKSLARLKYTFKATFRFHI